MNNYCELNKPEIAELTLAIENEEESEFNLQKRAELLSINPIYSEKIVYFASNPTLNPFTYGLNSHKHLSGTKAYNSKLSDVIGLSFFDIPRLNAIVRCGSYYLINDDTKEFPEMFMKETYLSELIPNLQRALFSEIRTGLIDFGVEPENVLKTTFLGYEKNSLFLDIYMIVDVESKETIEKAPYGSSWVSGTKISQYIKKSLEVFSYYVDNRNDFPIENFEKNTTLSIEEGRECLKEILQDSSHPKALMLKSKFELNQWTLVETKNNN